MNSTSGHSREILYLVKFLVTPYRKLFLNPVFRKWKIQELSISYFQIKLLDINLRDQKFGQKFLKLPDGLETRNFSEMCSNNFYVK